MGRGRSPTHRRPTLRSLSPGATLRLRVAAAVLDDGRVDAAEVVVEGGVITAVTPTGRTGAAVGGTLVPGFVDLQVNGIDDLDVAVARDGDWDRFDRALVRQGVTAWCPTLVSAPLDAYGPPLERIAAAARRAGPRPSVLGAHLEGPFLGSRRGAHPASAVVAPDPAWLEALPEVVALVTLGPEAEGALDAVRSLVAGGRAVALGHTDAPPALVAAGAEAGAVLFTHLFNGSGGIAARRPGPVGAALVEDRLAVSVIADLVHLDPVVLEVVRRATTPDRLVLVTDAVAWDTPEARALGVRRGDDGAARLPDGTLAGTTLTMDRAVRNLVAHTGADLAAAVRAAAANPARVLGATDRGRLAVGCRGDLVLLDDHLEVAEVWIGGVAMP